MMGVRYTICHWAINRTDPQNSLSMTLDVPLQEPSMLYTGMGQEMLQVLIPFVWTKS